MHLWQQLLLIVIFSFLLSKSSLSKRLFVFEHFRHGARGPIKPIDSNSDIFKENWNGVGELSSVGLRMLYLLGINKKKRYSTFLSKVFNTNEILIYSTNINRTITSVNAYMQGLYPEPSGIQLDSKQLEASFPQLINKDTLQPVVTELGLNTLPNQMTLFPIHIFNPLERTFLLNDGLVCPGVTKHKKANVESAEMQLIMTELYNRFDSSFGATLRTYLKITDPKYYYDREKLFTVTDTVISDVTDARQLKDLKDTKIDMKALYTISQEMAYVDAYKLEFNSEHNKISIMAMSPMFDSIISWMEKRIAKDKEGKGNAIDGSAPRMVIYSGHDTTMATMHLFIEEVFQVKIDDHTYASNQHFELMENEGRYTVEYYSNDEKKMDIPFEDFKAKIQKVLWTKKQIDNYCDEKEEEKEKEKRTDPFFIATIVLGSLTFVLIIALIVMIRYTKKRNENLAAQVNRITAIL